MACGNTSSTQTTFCPGKYMTAYALSRRSRCEGGYRRQRFLTMPGQRSCHAIFRSSQRLQNLVSGDVLVVGNSLEDGVERPDAQVFVGRHGDPVMERLFCLQDNVTAFLMDLPVTPIAAEDFDQFLPAE